MTLESYRERDEALALERVPLINLRRGIEKRRRRTLEVHALFFPKASAETLQFGSESSLDIARSRMPRVLWRRERVV